VLRLQAGGVEAFRHFKLDILELRDGANCDARASGANMSLPAVSRFGMLLCHGSLCHDAAIQASVDMNVRLEQSLQCRQGALTHLTYE